MTASSQQIAKELAVASYVCNQFTEMQFSCAHVVAQLIQRLQLTGQPIIYINVEEKAHRRYIAFLPSKKNASESGKHWAVKLHGKVFDNLHPKGEVLSKWLGNFLYADVSNGGRPVTVAINDIEYWSPKQFKDYWGDDFAQLLECEN